MHYGICDIMDKPLEQLLQPNLPEHSQSTKQHTVYPKKYAHGLVVLCFVVVMQSFIMNSHEVFIHIHQGCFAGTGAIVRLPQCQWSKPDGYGKISQCITTTKHSKAKTCAYFLGYTVCYSRSGLYQHQHKWFFFQIQNVLDTSALSQLWVGGEPLPSSLLSSSRMQLSLLLNRDQQQC